MAGRKKLVYTGRGSWVQVPVSDAEHKAFADEAEELGLPITQYGRLRLFQYKSQPIIPVQDQTRPENKHAHQRLEALLNRLDEGQREMLWRMLDAAFPATKGKRAS